MCPHSVSAMLPEALVLGLSMVVRFVHVLSSSFPLGDGGLFLLMVQRLKANGYAIPEHLTYNGVTIPFAYPPLGFFATGFASDVSGANELGVMRFFPLVIDCITVAVVWAFARSFFGNRGAALSATFAFGMLPLGYRYFIMGAGITRAPGLLFAVVTIWLTYLLCRRRRAIFVIPLGLAAGLTVLTYPNAAWFAAYSSGLVLLFFCRTRRTLPMRSSRQGEPPRLPGLAGPEYLALRVRPVRSRLAELQPRAPGYGAPAHAAITEEPMRLSLRRWPSSGSSSARGVANGGFRRGCWPPAYLIRDTPGHLQWFQLPLSGVAGSAIWFRIIDCNQWHCPGVAPCLVTIAAWIALLACAGALLPALRSERSRRPTWQPWVGLRRQPRSVRPFS